MRSILLLWILLAKILVAGEINIAVAANVSYAIEDIKKAFAKVHPEVKVNVILGGSGKLTAQIRHGAPYGLFMSANMIYPQALYDAKIAINRPVVYTQGALAYLSVRPQDFSQGATVLEDAKIQRIAIANPKTAPYGVATIEALKNAKVYKKIKSKFVYGESIAQTVAYTVTAADIGIVAKSSLYSKTMAAYKEGINWTSVDPSLYAPIKQGIVLIDSGKDYKAFYDFILSEEAARIFKKYGYITP